MCGKLENVSEIIKSRRPSNGNTKYVVTLFLQIVRKLNNVSSKMGEDCWARVYSWFRECNQKHASREIQKKK